MKKDIHGYFELTYANYLAIPRSVLQTMPEDWQDKFVTLLEELDEKIDWRRNGCEIRFRDSKGKFMRDEFTDYKHTNYSSEEIHEMVERHNNFF